MDNILAGHRIGSSKLRVTINWNINQFLPFTLPQFSSFQCNFEILCEKTSLMPYRKKNEGKPYEKTNYLVVNPL